MKVSVITPSYNQGQFIQRTIESVLSQAGVDLEYFVFDGGSTDNTVEVLRKFGSQICWQSQTDKGQADAVNKGIQASTGEIIGWLNSDDIYYPGAIQRAVDYFAKHPDVDVIYGMADHIDINDKPFEAYPTREWDFIKLQSTCYLCQPAVFFRRSVIERNGLLDVNLHYCMDYEYWLRLGAAGVQFGYLYEKLAGSRMYKDNKNLRDRLKVSHEINDMLKRDFGRVRLSWLCHYASVTTADQFRRIKFPIRNWELAARLLFASWRWNGSISPELKQMILRLVRYGRKAGWTIPPIVSQYAHIYGLYYDGWASEVVTVYYETGSAPRLITFELHSPSSIPLSQFEVVISVNNQRFANSSPRLLPNGIMKIEAPITAEAGV